MKFPFSVEVDVRGYEIDVFGHTNNSVYMNWIEHVRWEMYRVYHLDEKWGNILPVARHIEVDFQNETYLGDRIRITLWPRSVGNTSFTFGVGMRIIDAIDPERVGKIAATAQVVQVCTEPGKGKVPVPEGWKHYFPAEDPGPEPPE